ncbi:Uncharacterised protein [uncultured archaeon]|nr:Uncharacterised protein [uncultured archaeon]
MKRVKVHHCISQEMVAQQIEEPPARKCRCREMIEYKEADQKVKKGEARWTVVGRERGEHKVVCPMCGNKPEIRNCANCSGTGTVVEPVIWETFGADIVLVSQAAADPKEKKYRPALAMKTPRVATIESEHIELAYVDGNKEAQERIEEYGRLILDARAFVGPNRLPAIKSEPKDNASRSEGRTFDYGRAI